LIDRSIGTQLEIYIKYFSRIPKYGIHDTQKNELSEFFASIFVLFSIL